MTTATIAWVLFGIAVVSVLLIINGYIWWEIGWSMGEKAEQKAAELRAVAKSRREAENAAREYKTP